MSARAAPRLMPVSLIALAALLLPIGLAAQSVRPLSVEAAVAAGLGSDPGVKGAAWDLASARAKAKDAADRMLPSVALSTGYTMLSQEPGVTPVNTPDATVNKTVNYLLGAFTGGPTDSRDVRVDLQYPVFAGFRVREAIQISKLQVLGKEAAAELSRRALAFEIRRSYWESVRASANVAVLERNLELEKLTREDVRNLVEQGMATTADSLAEDARFDQTTLALDDAKSMLELSLLQLSTLIGDRNASASTLGELGYDLVSKPGEAPLPASGLSGPIDEAALVETALANRPESRGAVAALGAANHALAASRADQFPTVVLNGSISYADPDPRLFPPVDKFNLTWSAGIRLRYELGGMPGAIERGKAAEADLEKARADIARARNGIALDVRRCVLALKRSQTSLELTHGLVGQAEESLRVTRQKYDNGLAKNSDVLQAEIATLRAGLAVESKAIDLEIARADLARAAAMETL